MLAEAALDGALMDEAGNDDAVEVAEQQLAAARARLEVERAEAESATAEAERERTEADMAAAAALKERLEAQVQAPQCPAPHARACSFKPRGSCVWRLVVLKAVLCAGRKQRRSCTAKRRHPVGWRCTARRRRARQRCDPGRPGKARGAGHARQST
jgi:hypothetical protein